MSEDIPDTVYAQESKHIAGRVSQRATCYHTEEHCRQTDSVVEIDGADADRRGLNPCTYCAGGGLNPGEYKKKYAWDIKAMSDEERAALADKITSND